MCLRSDPVRWLITVSSERWSFWIETALWLGVDSSHLCWPDSWGAWLRNWSELTAGCRWNVPTCKSMFDALTLESRWAGCVVSVFCLMFCPASVSEKWLSEAAWLARFGPVWFCFGFYRLLLVSCLQYFLCHQVSWEGSFVFLQASFYESRGCWWIILCRFEFLRWKLMSIQKYENSMWRHKVYDNVIMKFREDMI